MNLVAFDKLDGVPIYYARQPVAAYGAKGKGPRTVRLDADFKKQLEVCLMHLWSKCPLGKPTELVSGGCYVEKAGRHGEGRAIDIDAIWWGDKSLITKKAEQQPVLYLGIESVLRLHIGMVLDFWYNQAHEDHWHCDNGTSLGWRGSRNQVLFTQAALSLVHGQNIGSSGIDGVMGKDTRQALASALGVDGIIGDLGKVWSQFLELTATKAFAWLTR